MSSTKLEVHNVSQRSQRRTQPLLQTTCSKNLVKFASAVFKLWNETNRHSLQITTSCYGNSSSSPHCRQAWILFFNCFFGIMVPVFPSNSWFPQKSTFQTASRLLQPFCPGSQSRPKLIAPLDPCERFTFSKIYEIVTGCYKKIS